MTFEIAFFFKIGENICHNQQRININHYTAVQGKKAESAYLQSKQIITSWLYGIDT